MKQSLPLFFLNFLYGSNVALYSKNCKAFFALIISPNIKPIKYI